MEREREGIQIKDALIALGSEPLRFGQGGTVLQDSVIVGGAVPKWMRRPRLRWLHPALRRYGYTRQAWRWSKGKTGPPAMVWAPFSYEEVTFSQAGVTDD